MATLYSEVLLDHFRHPRNYGGLPSPDIAYEDVNPLCGDRIMIEVKLNDSVIETARFRGDGCAISLAAASILTEMIVGVDVNLPASISEDTLLSTLQSDIKPARVQCALLPLEVLRTGLKEYKDRPLRAQDHSFKGEETATD